MKSTPLVSVAIPTYNHGPYIEQCIKSILSQRTNFPFEVCIGEDSSNDKTREVCLRLAEEHPNIIRLHLRDRKDVIFMHGRPTGRFNFIETLKSCRGKYIAICDGDDFWLHPEKLQKQHDFLESNAKIALCHANMQVFYQESGKNHDGYVPRKIKKKAKKLRSNFRTLPPRRYGINDLAKGNKINMPSVFFRNWLLDHPVPDFMWTAGAGDWALHMNTARFGKIGFMNETLALYRVHKGGIWSGTNFLTQRLIDISTAVELLKSPMFSRKTRTILNRYVKRRLKTAMHYHAMNGADPAEKHLFALADEIHALSRSI